MSGISIIILCTILAYMCLLIGVGAYNARKNSSSEDFYLGGRKIQKRSRYSAGKRSAV